MKVCSNSHEEIVHEFSQCPLCEAINELKNEIAILERDNKQLRGQIDAINGKIKFERVQTDDGESVWKEKANP